MFASDPLQEHMHVLTSGLNSVVDISKMFFIMKWYFKSFVSLYIECELISRIILVYLSGVLSFFNWIINKDTIDLNKIYY